MNRYVLVKHPHGYPCIGFDETVDVEHQRLHVMQFRRSEHASPWARRAISCVFVFQLAHILMTKLTPFRIIDVAFSMCGYFGVMVVTRVTPMIVMIHYIYLVPLILVIVSTRRIHDPIELARLAFASSFFILYPVGFGSPILQSIDGLEESGDGV